MCSPGSSPAPEGLSDADRWPLTPAGSGFDLKSGAGIAWRLFQRPPPPPGASTEDKRQGRGDSSAGVHTSQELWIGWCSASHHERGLWKRS